MRRSVVGFVRNNEVPHIVTYETHQQSWEISFITRKRLLQQYLPLPDSCELPRGKLISTLSSPAILFANHAAPCRQALGGMLLHPLGEMRRTH
jgi:hypothetical protein